VYSVLVDCHVYAWSCVWLTGCVIVLLLGSTGRCFQFAFSYSDRVRHVPDRISLFLNLPKSRKFVFVYDLSEFDFVFVSKCESENNIGVIPTEFYCFQPYF
jgi:hypothetical protein